MKINEFFKKMFLGPSPPAPSEPTIALQEKRSRIWGADDEFSYEDARSIWSQGIPQPRKLQTYDDYVAQYGNNVWVYAAAYQIGVSIASVPLIGYQKKYGKVEGSKMLPDKHELTKLLRLPNPYMSTFDLIEAVTVGLELTGNAYLEEVKGGKGKFPIEIYPLQPHKMEIIPDSQDLVGGYIYNAGSVRVPFNAEDITHIKYHNPTSDFYGQSGITPSESTVITDNNARKWNRKFFNNSAIPTGALETEDQLSTETVKRLRAEWNAVHKGVERSHSVAVLEGGLKWKNIQFNPKDMDFINLKKMTRDEILITFGVPPAILGLIDSANNSIMENMKKIFWENTLLPKMQKIESAININLVWPYDENIYVAFDKDSIEALKGTMETRARIASMLVDRGIMTQNEVRKKYFNMPEIKWGDTWYMPLNLLPVEKAGQGMGTGTGQEGDKIPGRTVGRPAVEEENLT
jgi:HK97 family phage portal protein